VFAAASIALLLPCLWQPRLQAGDLGSHIYNAWLAQLIEEGRAPGLAIVAQFTNVLFDLMLSGLFRLLGAGAAQHIAVMASVLVFVWGAFAFVSKVAGRRAWHAMPCLAVLAYGWVFHMGLFNFYLSLGMCFFAMALGWEYRSTRLAAAALILLVAFTAHALPPVWSAAALAYRLAALRGVPYLLTGGLAAIVLLHFAMTWMIQTRWYWSQILMTSGADQAYVYDQKYCFVSIGLALLWAVMAVRSRGSIRGIPFQICLLTAAGIVLIPTWVFLPQYKHALVFIAERMALALGVCWCAALAAAPARRWQHCAAIAVAGLFFVFLYSDERSLNALEDQIADAAAEAPPGARLVTAIQAPQLRTNPIDHMIDRDCIGHCYSYANYEPSTAQFRIRVIGPTNIVAPTYVDSYLMESGRYVVKEGDLPLYRISLDGNGRAVQQSLPAGVLVGVSIWQ
jgi:hypothetical protein